MEDDHGTDDIRSFILQTLINHKVGKIGCCLCAIPLVVYDRYPLLDGTFFFSPRQHAKESIPVSILKIQTHFNVILMLMSAKNCIEMPHTKNYYLHFLDSK